MQTVSITELKNNLSAYIEQVQNGEELIVKNHNRPVARVIPLNVNEDLDEEEAELVAAGLMRLPLKEKSDDFLDYPAPDVPLEAIREVLRAERDGY